MSIRNPNIIELLQDLKQIVTKIPADLGGGSPLSKTFLMAYLALEYDLKNYVEIGVYKGRSFFPMAYAAKFLNGKAYGIDAYDYETAKEFDLDKDLEPIVNDFLASLDFLQIYDDVKKLREELAFTHYSEIIREDSSVAVNYLRENNITINMLHIDGNHDTRQVLRDVDLYVPLVREDGFIVIDDIDWDSVKPVFHKLREKYEVVFNNGQFAILSISKDPMPALQKHRLNILHSLVENTIEPAASRQRRVSVAVITYNQEEYIAECLDGVFAQKGDFLVELVIGDDYSTDSTLAIIRNYTAALGNHRFEVKILTAAGNMGMSKNLQRTLAACTGEYIAVCEGDDYWVDSYKLQKQMNFLKFHPECALCFNDIYMYFQEKDECTTFDLQQTLKAEVITTRALILNYYIGNLSCCMYDARVMKKIPSSLFDLFIGDWMLNICCSQFGDIGHVKELLSVYRKHDAGVWSGNMLDVRDIQLHQFIHEYNKFLNYRFDREFSKVQKRIESTHADHFFKEPLDIAIIDDAFPHPLSAFRLQEISSYLKEFDNLKVYSTGESLPWLGQRTLDELFLDFKERFPEFARKIERWEVDTIINTKLFYFIFLGNTYRNIDQVEKLGVPFVFTLYPGSLFGINNEKSDRMLKRVTSSPCFRTVIVTQKITYDYLIEKKFCKPSQIKFIFGVVVPLEQMEIEYLKEKHFGIDKSTLDICFVAHKYAPTGVDKGYDVFIQVARELCKRYKNIQFHVVGGFDRDAIDVKDLGNRITFYGRQEMRWFDDFYKDKDIILSPNIPFMNTHVQGSFDGFPTASCTDAGLRKTAMFCTDELGLNTEFSDREEIVIIPHDVSQVTSILEHYYLHPEEIKMIAESGSRRIKQIYGYEAQILPRINILRKEVKNSESSRNTITAIINTRIQQVKEAANQTVNISIRQQLGQLIYAVFINMARRSPAWIKNLLRRIVHRLRSYDALFAFMKRIIPKFVLRLLVRLRELG